MAFSDRKAKAWGCATLAVMLSVAAITLTPIGPIGFYGWLVPIIPKPDGVPSRSNAEYHWKGFGLTWYWENRVNGGCAQLWAADEPNGPVRGLSIFEGENSCEEGGADAVSPLVSGAHNIWEWRKSLALRGMPLRLEQVVDEQAPASCKRTAWHKLRGN